MNTLNEVWDRLSTISVLLFKAESFSKTDWSGSANGVVKVSAPTTDVLVFEECGFFKKTGGNETRFTNVFRWTQIECEIRLEHLRFGVQNPVYIFDLTLEADGVWREVNPHQCSEDCYRASLQIEDDALVVRWLVEGPTMKEIITYTYL